MLAHRQNKPECLPFLAGEARVIITVAAGIAYLNAAVVPRIANITPQLLPTAQQDGLLEAACQDTRHPDLADLVHEDGREKALAHHFLAFELQDGVVMRAAHTWVHVPQKESSSFDLDSSSSAEDLPECQPVIVSVQPLLRTAHSERGAVRRQVFHAHTGEWGPEVPLHR